MIDLQILTDPRIYAVDENKVLTLAQHLLSSLSLKNQELSILIVHDEKIKELNSSFRGKDSATDVLSFPQNDFETPLNPNGEHNFSTEHPGGGHLGDIIISLDTTLKNAISLEHSISREFCFLLIHGLLHLCGHDHQYPEEEKIMLEGQKLLLKQLETNTDEETKPLWFGCVTHKKDSQ